MKKLTYILSLLSLVLILSSFTDVNMDKKDKKEKTKTEKVTKKASKKDKKAKSIKTADKKQRKIVVEDTITNSVWAFGFSASFTDSILYMTDIQQLHNVKITKKTKFMEGRYDYSSQMKRYLEDNLNMKNRTCVLFFEEKKEAAEKKYVAIRKRYQAQTHLTLRYLNASEFQFTKLEEEEE